MSDRSSAKEIAQAAERKSYRQNQTTKPNSQMSAEVMKVKVRPFNYIGHIIERGQVFHTVRLASGALLIAPVDLVEAVE
jgi:hypothetical protein